MQVGLRGRDVGLPPSGLQGDVPGDGRVEIVFDAVQVPAVERPARAGGGGFLGLGLVIHGLGCHRRAAVRVERDGMAGHLPLRVQGQGRALGRIGDGRARVVCGSGAVGLGVPSGERVSGAGELAGRRGGRRGARLGGVVQVFASGRAVADVFDGALTVAYRIGNRSVRSGAGLKLDGPARVGDLGRVGGGALFRGGVEADGEDSVDIVGQVAVVLQILVGGRVIGFRARIVSHGFVAPQGTHVDVQVGRSVRVGPLRPAADGRGGAFLRRHVDSAGHVAIVFQTGRMGVICSPAIGLDQGLPHRYLMSIVPDDMDVVDVGVRVGGWGLPVGDGVVRRTAEQTGRYQGVILITIWRPDGHVIGVKLDVPARKRGRKRVRGAAGRERGLASKARGIGEVSIDDGIDFIIERADGRGRRAGQCDGRIRGGRREYDITHAVPDARKHA